MKENSIDGIRSSPCEKDWRIKVKQTKRDGDAKLYVCFRIFFHDRIASARIHEKIGFVKSNDNGKMDLSVSSTDAFLFKICIRSLVSFLILFSVCHQTKLFIAIGVILISFCVISYRTELYRLTQAKRVLPSTIVLFIVADDAVANKFDSHVASVTCYARRASEAISCVHNQYLIHLFSETLSRVDVPYRQSSNSMARCTRYRCSSSEYVQKDRIVSTWPIDRTWHACDSAWKIQWRNYCWKLYHT